MMLVRAQPLRTHTLTALHAIGLYKRCPLCGSELYAGYHHDTCSDPQCQFGK